MTRPAGKENFAYINANEEFEVVLNDSRVLRADASGIVSGSLSKASVSVPVLSASVAQTTLTATQHLVMADATTANFGIVLPDAAAAIGKSYTVKKVDAGANLVILSGSGTDNIEGAAILSLNSEGESVTVMSDGVHYRVVAFYSGNLGV